MEYYLKNESKKVFTFSGEKTFTEAASIVLDISGMTVNDIPSSYKIVGRRTGDYLHSVYVIPREIWDKPISEAPLSNNILYLVRITRGA